MTRLLHFSDIHAQARLTWRGLLDKRLLGYANYRVRRHCFQDWRRVRYLADHVAERQPDLVVCTGDVSTLGDPGEFRAARLALQPLVDDSAIDLVYIPGNHDAYVHDRASREALDATFRYLNRERWRLADLPLVHVHGALRLLLLNQAVPAPLFSSHGALDEATCDWLTSHLDALAATAETLVLVSHFPLFDAAGKPLSRRRACRHIEPLQAALRDGRIDLALCGHIHRHFARREPGGGLEVCAGSLTHTGVCNLVTWRPGLAGFEQSWVELDPPGSRR